MLLHLFSQKQWLICGMCTIKIHLCRSTLSKRSFPGCSYKDANVTVNCILTSWDREYNACTELAGSLEQLCRTSMSG